MPLKILIKLTFQLLFHLTSFNLWNCLSPVLLWNVGEEGGAKASSFHATVFPFPWITGIHRSLETICPLNCAGFERVLRSPICQPACVSLTSYDHFVKLSVPKKVYFSWLSIGFNDVKGHLSEIFAVLNLTQLEESGFLVGHALNCCLSDSGSYPTTWPFQLPHPHLLLLRHWRWV